MVMLISRRGPLFNATCSMMARRKNSQAATLLKIGNAERSKLNLFSAALTPGYAFGVLVIIVCAFSYVPQGALVPSLLVAAVASLLSGFCYSELVSHVANVQRETSVYELLYKWLNEGFAYFVAWVLVIYHTCATALSARILAVCLDVLSNGALGKLTLSSGLKGIDLDLGVVMVVIPCSILLLSWNPLSRLIVDPSNGRVRSWVNFLLIASVLLVEGVFVAGVAFLRDSTVKPVPPPGGVLGTSIAALVFRHSEPAGLLTGAVLCVSIFLAPQFSLQGFSLSSSNSNNVGLLHHENNNNNNNKISPHKDLPRIVVISAFGNFIFCLALIAALCSMSKSQTAVLVDPLSAHASSKVSASIAIYINCAITGLSTVSLTLLTISNLTELNKILRTLGQDGLFPRICKHHQLFVSVAISIWSGLVLRAGQLAMMMSSGPVLMNALICFCTIVFRYRKVETCKPAVFSYNLIVNGSADNEQTPILGKSQSELSAASVSNNDLAEKDKIEDCPADEDDIDDIVNEYKSQHILSQESLPILPPNRRAKLTRKTGFVKYFIVGLLACFVCVSLLLQGLSCSLHLSSSVVATMATCALATVTCALSLILALARQKQVIPKNNRPNKAGKPALMFRVPMSPWLPALGAFLNVLLFVDVLTTNLCSMFCWFIAGGLMYVLYGVHHSTATNAFPCVLQTNSRQMVSHSEDGTDVKVTLEPLPVDPWAESDYQCDEKNLQSLDQQQRRGKKKDPLNPIDNIVMKL